MKFKIEEICEINSRSLSKNDNFEYINYLDTGNLTLGKIDQIQKLEFGKDKIPSRAKRKVKNKDILISTVRPNQKHYGILKNVKENMIVSTGFAVFSANESIVDSRYLYDYLTQDKVTELLQSIAETSTTAYPSIKPSDIGDLEIDLPPLEEQKAIAKILSDLDNKIEINNKINKNLEETAQAIFKQWFIDFEFPCVPENYKFSGASKPCNPEGAGKPCNPNGAGKPRDFDKVCTYKRVGGLPIPDGDSWFVYVLLCEDGSFYKGMTKDLYRRFYEHYTGIGAEWTKTHKPVKVIHYEKFNTQEEARKREEELKSGYGREWIKREYKKYQQGLSAYKANSDLSANQTSMMMAGLPAHQTCLVPAGEMVESELGMIPNGWRIDKIGNVTTIIRGASPRPIQEYISTNGMPWVKISDATSSATKYLLNTNEFIKIEGISKSRKIDKGTLILSNSATPGLPMISLIEACVHDGWLIFNGYKDITKEFLYYYLQDNREQILALSNGSVFRNLKTDILKSYNIIIPDERILIEITEIFKKYNDLIIKNVYEISALVELRDILLPKLMSGEIRVNID